MRLYAVRISVLVTVFLGGSACEVALQEESRIVGYVRSGHFHPLIVRDSVGITPANSSELNLLGRLVNAFESGGQSAALTRQEDYVDPFTDVAGRFGLVEDSVPERGHFYYLNGSTGELLPTDGGNDPAAVSFYRFFASDQWGRRFIEQEWLTLPAEEIARRSDVVVHFVTDLDRDGQQEVWITYRLKYGEVGALVYEETGVQDRWVLLVDHCYVCD